MKIENESAILTPHPDFVRVKETVARMTIAASEDNSEEIDEEFGNLLEVYKSREDVVRFAVILDLPDVPQAKQVLIHVLENEPSGLIRHEAAFRLGLTKDPELVPMLCEKLLTDVNAVARHEIALALGTIGDPRAIEPLEELYELEKAYGRYPYVHESCLVAIYDIEKQQKVG